MKEGRGRRRYSRGEEGGEEEGEGEKEM